MTVGVEVWLERRKAWTDPAQILQRRDSKGKAVKNVKQSASRAAATAATTPAAEQVLAATEKRRAAGLRPALDNAHDSQRTSIYDRIVEQRLKLKVPLNLRQVVPCLKQGWIKNGLWPKDA